MTIIGNRRAATPWHLWVLGIVSLVWFAGGANDYIMTKTANQAYLGMAADSMGVSVDLILDYFNAYPMWATVCWALGVWGAVAGSLLLLLRYMHILGAIALMGGTIFMRFALAPTVRELDPAVRASAGAAVSDRVPRRWATSL